MTDSEDLERPSSPTKAAGLLLPWPALSVVLATIALGSLGTLAVVTTVGGADALSTIALALAILAFAAQIVASVAQSQAASQTTADIHRVNAETRGLLSQIRSQSESLLTNQREQFGDVLKAALNRDAIKEVVRESTAQAGDADGSSVSTQTVDELTARIQENLINLVDRRSLEREKHAPGNPYQDIVERMTKYPSEELGSPAQDLLETLSPLASALLVRRATEDLQRARQGVAPQGWIDHGDVISPASRELVEKGILEYTPGVVRGRDVLVRKFTPLGQTVASLVLGNDPLPDWLRARR